MVKQGSILVILQATNIAIAFIISILMARMVSPEEYGIYALCIAIVTLLALPAVSGLTPLLTREIAKYRSQKEFKLLNGVIKFANITSYLVSAVIVVVTVLVLYFVFSGSVYYSAVLTAVILIPLSASAAIRGSILKGFEKTIFSVAIDQLGRSLILLILLLVLSSLVSSAKHLILFNALSIFLVFCVSTFIVKKIIKREVLIKDYELESKKWLLSLIPFAAIAYVQVASMQLNTIMLGVLGNPESVAMFKVATNGALVVGLFQVAINTILSPLASRAFATRNIELIQSKAQKLTRVATLAAFLAFTIILLFGEKLLSITFGHDYIEAYITMAILSLGQLLSTACGPCNILLNMANRQNETVVAVSIGLITNLVLGVLLIPIFGHIGAAISFSVSMLIWNLILVVKAKRILDIKTFFRLKIS